jgi:8-oxo-dGTP pyrophosphatase MutT (NUDIX family)
MSKHLHICNNCGKQGHLFNQCKLPIISYGIIVYRYNNNTIQYLMIRRKDSFGYIDFIRGKYLTYNIFQLQNIINEMSINEKKKILTEPFDKLWKDMWGETTHSQYKNEEMVSNKKFDSIKNGIEINNKLITLQEIIDNSNTKWIETEWEFPKGRRNFKERDLDCALREFEEETGLSKNNIKIIDNLIPFEETFIGTNHKCYKHKYFLACDTNLDLCNLSNFQKAEVSKIEWKTYEECLQSIRPYNLEKKQVITNIHNILQKYQVIPIYL